MINLTGLESHMASIWELTMHIVRHQVATFDLDTDEIRATIRLVYGTLTYLHYLEQHDIPLEVKLINQDLTRRCSTNEPQASKMESMSQPVEENL